MREQLTAADFEASRPMSVSGLQAAMHPDQLRIAKMLAETQILLEDLADIRVSLTETGHARCNAREGQHDDLVPSAALAVWRA
jgi:hypothetical protein